MHLTGLETLWIAIANHLWQCTLVLGPLLWIGLGLRNATARAQNVLWSVAAVKLLLPLSFVGRGSLALIDAVMPGRGDALALSYSESAVARWLAPTEVWVVSGKTAGAGALDPFLVATLAWLAGGLALSVYWARRRSRLRGASPPSGADSEARRRIDAALAGTPVPPDRVVVSGGGTMPALVGLWRPRIVVPATVIERLPHGELRAVVLHEAAHLHRRDAFRAVVLRVLMLLFYYFPPLWIVARRLRDTTELACDEWVLARGVPREVYVRALARAVSLGIEPAPALAAGGGASPSLLRRRFDRIRDSGRYRDMPRHRVLLGSAIALVAIASFYPFAPSWMVVAEEPPVAGELSRLAGIDVPVILDFEERDLGLILEAISKTVGFEVRYEGEVPDPLRTVTVRMSDVTASDVLVRIAELTGVTYRVPDPDTLVVVAPNYPGVDGVTDPRIIAETRVMPKYPEEARKNKIQGKVILQARIDELGGVDRVKVLEGIPDHPEMGEAAMEAVRQWRYQPSTKNGKPVAVHFTVIVEFSLE